MSRPGSDLKRTMAELASAINAAPNDYTCRMGQAGHWLVFKQDGDGASRVWSFASTPSSSRAAKNYIAEAKKRGYAVRTAMPTRKLKTPSQRELDLSTKLETVLRSIKAAEFVRHGIELGKQRGLRVWKTTDAGSMSVINFRKRKTASAWVLDLFELTVNDILGIAPQPIADAGTVVTTAGPVAASTDATVAPEPTPEPAPEPTPEPKPPKTRVRLLNKRYTMPVSEGVWVPQLAFEALARMKWDTDYERTDCIEIAQRIAEMEWTQRRNDGEDDG